MRHFLKLQDFNAEDIREVLERAHRLKANRCFDAQGPLQGQFWALMFSKSSTRTRTSFEVGIQELGGRTLVLNRNDIQLGRGEPVKDTARVLGRMLHGAVIRTYDQEEIVDFARYANIPTINALTDEEHPCQILADIFTFEETRGPIKGRKVAFIGDAACNVARSWVMAAEVMDFRLVCAAPEEFQSEVTNERTELVTNTLDAARDADLLYTDVWVSMGKEDEEVRRKKAFQGYQINHETLGQASSDVLVLHCLPAYRGLEITDEVFEQFADDIFRQAENRLHVQKAILEFLTAENAKG